MWCKRNSIDNECLLIRVISRLMFVHKLNYVIAIISSTLNTICTILFLSLYTCIWLIMLTLPNKLSNLPEIGFHTR